MDAIKQLADSKKAMVLLAGLLIIAFSAKLGLETEQLQLVVAVIGTYIGAQGLADFGKAAKGK